PLLLFIARRPPPPRATLFPYTTLFRSRGGRLPVEPDGRRVRQGRPVSPSGHRGRTPRADRGGPRRGRRRGVIAEQLGDHAATSPDRKSTRLNSSHVSISYAVFCLKKKN